jgi:hypothetical protein
VKALKTELRTFQQVYIVVDALDECKKDVMFSLIASLKEISSTSHLLITSRPLLTIKELLNGFWEVEIIANYKDMEEYIDGRLQGAMQLTQIIDLHRDSISREEIRKKVIRTANGM